MFLEPTSPSTDHLNPLGNDKVGECCLWSNNLFFLGSRSMSCLFPGTQVVLCPPHPISRSLSCLLPGIQVNVMSVSWVLGAFYVCFLESKSLSFLFPGIQFNVSVCFYSIKGIARQFLTWNSPSGDPHYFLILGAPEVSQEATA